jgi:hypothetical protein
MSTSVKPATMPPTTGKGGKNASLDESKATVQRQFVQMALNMGWQLAVVVLVPVAGGAQLDKALDTNHVFLFVGLALALLGTVLVMWRTMQAANRLPVPKLTEAQKRAIKKSYDAEDNN